MSVKMDVLATRCVRLKLTLPSESSIKMIVASGLSWSNAVSDADHYMNVLKRLLHSKRKPVPKAGLHLTEYPGHPRELPQELFLCRRTTKMIRLRQMRQHLPCASRKKWMGLQ